MNLFIASGTHDFMARLYLKNKQTLLYLFSSQAETLLIQESNSKSIFSNPRRYQVLRSKGALTQSGVVLLSHFYIDKENLPLAQQQVDAFVQRYFDDSGLLAYRLLRPKSADAYVIYTQWQDYTSAKEWQDPFALLPKSSFIHHANPFTSQFYTKQYVAPTDIT